MANFKADTSEALSAFQRLQLACKGPKPAFQSIGEYYLREIDKRFQSQSGADGEFAPLTARYAQRKAKDPRAIQKILQYSGLYRSSFTYILTAQSVIVGSDRKVGQYHEEGTSKMAARSVLKPTAENEAQFARILIEYIEEEYLGR